MSKRKVIKFLRELDRNNSKDWMDENRERYHEAKTFWLEEVQRYLDRLSRHDGSLAQVRPKDCIMRINNNNVFHPDKPTYKDNFGFDPYRGRDRAAFYLHVSPNGSFLAGGMWHPAKESLDKLRESFDYNGEEFKEIVEEKKFAAFFGGLDEDEQRLKTSPREYSGDHRHIDLLRRKNFTASHPVTQKEFYEDGFIDTVEEAFLLLQPFNAYLQRAVDFEE